MCLEHLHIHVLVGGPYFLSVNLIQVPIQLRVRFLSIKHNYLQLLVPECFPLLFFHVLLAHYYNEGYVHYFWSDCVYGR